MMKVEHINVKAFVDTDGTETGEVGKIVPITLIPSARHTRVRKLKTLIVSANDIDAAVTIGFQPIQYSAETVYTSNEEGGGVVDYNDVNVDDEDKEDDVNPNTEAAKRGLREDADTIRHDSRFYLLKNSSVPFGTALNLIEGFSDGIPFLANHSLFIQLGADGQSVSLILAYE